MKQKLTGLTQRYVTALRNHLKRGSHAGLQSALELGRRAVTLGLETLELARIHERALTILKLSVGKKTMIKRAEIFFTEAVTPIVETYSAARQNKIDLNRLNVKLAASDRQLRRGIALRKVMQDASENNGKRHKKSLEESLQLQHRLRQLTHRVLAANEDERQKISHELQDEIAQTLLGINARLLALKQTAQSDTRGLKNEIASTQQLVVRSAKSVRQFARQLEINHSAFTNQSIAKF